MNMNKALVLRTCTKDLTSRNDFTWPASGPVEAPDWNPKPVCGQGLHGLLWGQGDGSLLDFSPEANWLVVEVSVSDIVDLEGKVKFPKGNVIFCGTQLEATKMIHDRAPNGTVVVGLSLTREGPGQTVTVGYQGKATAGYGGTATAGGYGTATAGNGGTANAGYEGKATAGYEGKATAGDRGTANAGDYSTANAGYGGKANAGHWGKANAGHNGTANAGVYGTATAGDEGTANAGHWGKANAGHNGTANAGVYGTATAGNGGKANAGDYGTANAGYGGKANAGDYGTSTAGRYGTSTAGRYGTASAGVAGEVHIKWWDSGKNRYRTAVGYVGEVFKGAGNYEIMIEANVQYKCDTKGNLIKA